MLQGSNSISKEMSVLDSSLMESIIKLIHIASWQSISQRTWPNAFTLQSAAMHREYSNVCCKDKQHNRGGVEIVVGSCPGALITGWSDRGENCTCGE